MWCSKKMMTTAQHEVQDSCYLIRKKSGESAKVSVARMLWRTRLAFMTINSFALADEGKVLTICRKEWKLLRTILLAREPAHDAVFALASTTAYITTVRLRDCCLGHANQIHRRDVFSIRFQWCDPKNESGAARRVITALESPITALTHLLSINRS